MSIRKTEQDYHNLATQHNGKCLVIGKNTHDNSSQWQCNKKHIWNTSYHEIQQGYWCQSCSVTFPKTEQDYHNLAMRHDGKCLVVGKNTKDNSAQWQCKEKHVWNSSFNSVQQNHWCQECSIKRNGEARRLKIEDYHDLARRNNGRCLVIGKDAHDNSAQWQCSKEHIWNACHSSIQQGRWCPECSQYKREKICRSLLEKMLNCEFQSTWPDFLKTGSRNRLQLDGYNKFLKVGFEHQGKQHYEKHEIFHKTDADFKAQQKRDKDKRRLCKKEGIKLIVIPYWIPEEELETFIKYQLIKLDINIVEKGLNNV